jgi:hypothetical protein
MTELTEAQLFNNYPIEWLKQHHGKLENPFFDNPMVLFDGDTKSLDGAIVIQGNGVACVLSGDGTWHLEDTSGG